VRRKDPSLFEKSSETVLHDVKTWEALVERLQDVRLKDRELIQVVILGSDRNLPAYFQSKNAPPGIRHIESSESLSLFHYQRKFGRTGSRESVSGEFLVSRTDRETMYLLVFVSAPRFWRNGIQPLTESLYPKASSPFLTQNELHELLTDLQNQISPQKIRILEFSSKKRLGTASRKRFQSVREWTDMELESAFSEARDRNDWFRSVFFDIVNEKNGRLLSTEIQGKLSKYAHFACTGRFDLFEKVLLRKMVHLGAQRLKFFSNRDRQTSRAHSAVPLQIQYPIDIFKSRDQSKRLITAMQKFTHGTCTVLHGNPYVHVTMVDNKDFSSADLWVLSQDQILLVPQIRSSAVALKRIVNHIFENFREGKISEYKTTQG
jgi:hypothetical protein